MTSYRSSKISIKHLFGILIKVCALLAVMLIYCSCTDSKYEKSLLNAEEIMEEDPDSARRILAAIVENPSDSERLRAIYVLLNTQLQIKNNYWASDHDSLKSALNYFIDNPNVEEEHLMKTYYCYADLLQASDSLSEAAKASATAIDIASSRQDNLWIGKTNEQMADILADAMKPEKSIPFAEKAVKYYDKADRHRNSLFIKCDIANRYSAIGRPETGIALADSINRISRLPKADSLLTAYSLSAIAYGYLNLEDYSKARDCYKEIEEHYLNLYTFPTHEKIFIARCEIALGNTDRARQLLEDIDTTYRQDNYKLKHLKYLLSCKNDNQEAQLEALRQFTEERERLLVDINDISVLEGEREHFRQKADAQIDKTRNTAVIATIAILFTVLVMYLSIIIYRKKLKLRKEADIKAVRDSIDAKVEAVNALIAEKDDTITKLRAIHSDQLYKQKWEAVNILAKEYLKKKDSDNEKVKMSIFADLDSSLHKIFDADFFDNTEYHLNLVMDNVISLLREECPDFNEQTIQFIILCYLGLDTGIIAYIMNVSINNVYTTKNRIKARLKRINPLHLEMFLARF